MGPLSGGWFRTDTLLVRLSCPELVGRDEFLTHFSGALDAGRSGAGSLWCVLGVAGIGKSRLAREVAAAARRRGMSALTGRAVAGGPSAFRPLTEAFLAGFPDGPPDSAVFRRYGSALGQVVPVWQREARPEAPPVVVAEGVRRLLAEPAATQGCLLVVEDLHWADPDTVSVLRYLADHLAGTRVVVLATGRPAAGSPWDRLVQAIEPAGRVVRLPSLPADGIRAMAAASLGVDTGAIPAPLADALERYSAGSPFLIEELLTLWRADGSLSTCSRQPRVVRALRPVLPEAFAADVARRLATLPARQRYVVVAAALTDLALGPEELAASVGCPVEDVPSALDAAVEQGVLVGGRGAPLRFAHELSRRAVIAAGGTAVRALAGRLLGAAAPGGEQVEGLGEEQLADLAVLAGDHTGASRWLVRAGRRDQRRHALRSARQHLERARGFAGSPARRAEAEESLVEVLLAAGDVQSASDAADRLLDSLDEADSPAGRRGSARVLAARAAVAAGRWPAARDHLDAAAVHTEGCGDPVLAARITTLRAEVTLDEGDLETAGRLAEQAAAAAAGLTPPEVACEALELVGRAARGRDAAAARAAFTELLQRAERSGSTVWTTRGLYQLGTLDLLERFDIDRLVRARGRAERVGALALVAELELEITAGLQGAFRLDEARAAAVACVETAELVGMWPLAAKAWIFQAIIAGQAADRRAMEGFCRSALGRDDGPETEGAVWGDCRGLASLVAEKRDRALEEFARAAEIYGGTAAAIPRPAMALHQLVGAVAGDPSSAPPDWGATAQLCIAGGFLHLADAVRAGQRGDHGAAVAAAAAGDRLLAPAPWHRHLGSRLVAEAALADSWGDPVPWLTEAAEFFDRSGNEPVATTCRGLLRRSGQGVSGTRPRAGLPDRLRRAGVTTREAEVLRLLAEGGSNAAIAERLVLSRRTVEHHVASLLRKLGSVSRTELVATLHRDDDTSFPAETWVRAPMSR